MFRGRCFFVLLLYRKKTSLSISLPSSKLTIFLILLTKHDISNIADPSSTQHIYHIWTSSWTLLIIESLWLSGRASECRIWWSEVQFLIGAQNFFFVPCLYKMKKTSFSVALPSSKTYHLFLFYLQIFFFSVWHNGTNLHQVGLRIICCDRATFLFFRYRQNQNICLRWGWWNVVKRI